jgi:3-oxoadipate enol-lactonase
MPFSKVDDIVVHWRETGPENAPPILFANSLGTDFRIWDEVAFVLSDRYRVITYDKRGHGLTDETPGPYSIDLLARDALSLASKLGLTHFAFVGLSIGGQIAQRVAHLAGDRVKALVLCDTAAKIGDAAGWNARIDAIEKGGLGAIADGVMERWFSAEYRRTRLEELAGWRNMFLRSPKQGYLACCAALRDADLTSDAPKITAPTLAVVGSEDGSTPVDLVQKTAQLITGARFEVIDGSGHLPCLDQPLHLAHLIALHLTGAGYD